MEDQSLTREKPEAPVPQDQTAVTDDEHADADMLDSIQSHGSDDSESDDSSDSDSDSETEAQQNLQIQTLESELSTNPCNYDAYVQYIKVLRKMGELEKLRQAREAMSAIFPLSPSMWQEWARDEASISSGRYPLPQIEELYERGVCDYQSALLWCDYLNFLQEHDPSVSSCSIDGISKARSLFERAISAAGLHVTDGSKIWEAYRQFEQAIFLTIDEKNIEEKEKQVQRIRNIFHRQLSVPLNNLSSTLLAYKTWEVEQGNTFDAESSDLDGISPTIASAYKKALEMYNARAPLEEKISNKDLSDTEKYQQFMNYIKFEESFGDPARVQALYERAITEFPVAHDLWIDYTRYLSKTLKVGKVVRDIYSRATRSCPWVGELWVQYLLTLERNHASEKEISTVFEKSLQSTFSTLEEYLDLYLTRIDGLRRRMSLAGEGEALSYSLIRETFQQALDYLSPHMQSTDALLHLHAYWAQLELSLGNDLTAARGVWESLLKKSGSLLAAWQGYIDMEIKLGHIKEARSIYRRSYSRRFDGTGSEDICHAWLRFEREHGMLEDYDHAVQKVIPRLEELQLFRLQQESKTLRSTTDQKEHAPKKSLREKRKPEPNADEQTPAKRHKNKGQILREGEVEEKNITAVNTVETTKAEVGKAGNSNEEQREGSRSAKPKVYTDECTAFISNLNFKAREEDLRDFFSDVGGVVSIRILHDKFTGKSRGLAYIDFEDEEHLTAAIDKNKMMFLGKKLSVTRSNPKKGGKGAISRNDLRKHGEPSNQAGTTGEPNSKDSAEISRTSQKSKAPQGGQSTDRKRGDHVQLKGKNTFAVPRNLVRLDLATSKQNANELGDEKPKSGEDEKPKSDEDEKPKSNEEFRNMFLRK